MDTKRIDRQIDMNRPNVNTQTVSSQSSKSPLKVGVRYDIKLHSVIRLQFWMFEEYGLLFRYHYSQVHSDF